MKRRWRVFAFVAVVLVALIGFVAYRASQPPYAFLTGLEPYETKDLGNGDARLLRYAVRGTTEEWREKIDRELVPKGFIRARIPEDAKPRHFGWATRSRTSRAPSDASVGLTENHGGRLLGTHTIVLSFRGRGLLGWLTRTWTSMLNE